MGPHEWGTPARLQHHYYSVVLGGLTDERGVVFGVIAAD
jgi:hypothetical protein